MTKPTSTNHQALSLQPTSVLYAGGFFLFTFTGVITFTHDYDDIIKNAPLDTLLSETDAPYVTPVPHRGKRNEPAYVVEVVKKIAEIRGEDECEVCEQLVRNAERVFNLL